MLISLIWNYALTFNYVNMAYWEIEVLNNNDDPSQSKVNFECRAAELF